VGTTVSVPGFITVTHSPGASPLRPSRTFTTGVFSTVPASAAPADPTSVTFDSKLLDKDALRSLGIQISDIQTPIFTGTTAVKLFDLSNVRLLAATIRMVYDRANTNYLSRPSYLGNMTLENLLNVDAHTVAGSAVIARPSDWNTRLNDTWFEEMIGPSSGTKLLLPMPAAISTVTRNMSVFTRGLVNYGWFGYEDPTNNLVVGLTSLT